MKNLLSNVMILGLSMNTFKRTWESVSVLIIVILSIPAVSESSNIIPHAAAQVAPVVPNPPTGLATPYVSSSQISISWSAPLSDGGSPITGYKIERSTDGGTTWNIIAPNVAPTPSWYSNYNLLPSTPYTFRVSAINSVGTGSPSSTVSATTSPATVPNPPTGLATPYVSSSQISISWFAPSNNGGAPITGYKIESSTDGGTTWNIIAPNVAPSPSWYSNYNLLGSTTYTFRVSAINSVGTSSPSNTASATTYPPAASVTLNPSSGPTGTSVTVTGSNFAANSGMTVTYDGAAIPTTSTSGGSIQLDNIWTTSGAVSSSQYQITLPVTSGTSNSHTISLTTKNGNS